VQKKPFIVKCGTVRGNGEMHRVDVCVPHNGMYRDIEQSFTCYRAALG
jgi:hypothetical protein